MEVREVLRKEMDSIFEDIECVVDEIEQNHLDSVQNQFEKYLVYALEMLLMMDSELNFENVDYKYKKQDRYHMHQDIRIFDRLFH